MVCKIVSLFVGVAVLLQNLEAIILHDNKELSAEARKYAQIKLSKFVINELNSIAKMKLENSKNLAESLLNHPKIKESKTVVMETYLKDFQQFIEHWNSHGSKRLLTFARVDKLMSEEASLLRKFSNNNETKEATIISNVLKELVVEHQLELLKEPSKKLTNDFLAEADNYIKVLGKTKIYAKEKAALNNLIKKIKNESNDEKRLDLIIYYVQSFEFKTDEIL